MWPGSGVKHPPTSSADAKEIAELCLYSPSGPSWPVLGQTSFLPQFTSLQFTSTGIRAFSTTLFFIYEKYVQAEGPEFLSPEFRNKHFTV
jgi:hypothetical protein